MGNSYKNWSFRKLTFFPLFFKKEYVLLAVYLGTSQIVMMELFMNIASYRLKVVNYFSEKALSYMFNLVLNTSLTGALHCILYII